MALALSRTVLLSECVNVEHSPKTNLVFVCKTYGVDYDSFCRLFESYRLHNVDSIPFYVSVPEKDIKLFQSFVGADATVISDESYAGVHFTTQEYWGLKKGYINQEICKLSFWETSVAENYLCIDSDAYFIRDFYQSDFMADDKTPFSVLVMDKDLNMQNFYKEFGKWRLDLIKKIFETVGYEDRRYRTCHGMTVFNSKVLKDLKLSFMKKNKLEYRDLIKISPYEYTWYNAWLQKSKVIDVIEVEPFFKTFHMSKEYEIARISLIEQSDISEQYVGIILNSNWQDKKPPTTYENPKRIHRILYNFMSRLG